MLDIVNRLLSRGLKYRDISAQCGHGRMALWRHRQHLDRGALRSYRDREQHSKARRSRRIVVSWPKEDGGQITVGSRTIARADIRPDDVLLRVTYVPHSVRNPVALIPATGWDAQSQLAFVESVPQETKQAFIDSEHEAALAENERSSSSSPRLISLASDGLPSPVIPDPSAVN